MTKTPPALVDQRLVKALAHPLRVHILNILNERTASPNQLSKELGEDLSSVSYHVKVLKDIDCIAGRYEAKTGSGRALLSRNSAAVLRCPRMGGSRAGGAAGDHRDHLADDLRGHVEGPRTGNLR